MGLFEGQVAWVTGAGRGIGRAVALALADRGAAVALVSRTQSEVEQVAEEIRGRWPSVEGIAIVQRIGKLYPGTPTIMIACSAGHRDTGVFDAARYGIDRLKKIVPIWKKEIGPGGQTWVEGVYIPKPGE